MPLPTLFHDDATFGDDHRHWLTSLRKWWTDGGMNGTPEFRWETVDDERSSGIDLHIGNDAERYTIQLKRDRHSDENTVLETSRNVGQGLPGWIERDFPALDFLVMSYSDTVLHTFAWYKLRQWWLKVGRPEFWYHQRETHVSRSPTGSWSGAYVLVPTQRLHDEVGGWVTKL